MKYQEQLQKIQKYAGITQVQLAEMLNVSFPTLNSWINGKSKPRPKALEKIAHLYIEYVGDLNTDISLLDVKSEKLKNFQIQNKDPFGFIMSRRDVYDSFLLEMTYHTNSIEGSTFNEPEVKAVLFDDVTIPNKTVREHQEAKNHQGALGFVMRWIRDENGIITESFIKKIHEILMNGIMYNAGQYRTHAVRIAGSHVVTSNPLKVEDNMKSFIKRFNTQQEDIVSHIAQTHAIFEQIHPFSDGNGRVGRLLMLVLAFQNNLAPVLIKKEKKMAYYNYLQEGQVKENYIPLVSFVYDALFEGYLLLKE
jgi:Fic family protein